MLLTCSDSRWKMAIKHYATCRSDYPEKPEGEEAQAITIIELDDNEKVRQCNDCGAHEVVSC